jgi:hypothetical protein
MYIDQKTRCARTRFYSLFLQYVHNTAFSSRRQYVVDSCRGCWLYPYGVPFSVSGLSNNLPDRTQTESITVRYSTNDIPRTSRYLADAQHIQDVRKIRPINENQKKYHFSRPLPRFPCTVPPTVDAISHVENPVRVTIFIAHASICPSAWRTIAITSRGSGTRLKKIAVVNIICIICFFNFFFYFFHLLALHTHAITVKR